ncbi:MAG: hypothetical protein G01um101466_621 [Parcubacteria group bacterium Gr01-1014_66]|nr:MAG: hypothetical protein G01um101466_621 [Parcubacteria group bacterium Gr01-1014_66]
MIISMATTQLTEVKIKTLVRESVKEAFRTEFMKLRALLVQSVSDAEQADIERRYKRPSRKTIASHTIEV